MIRATLKVISSFLLISRNAFSASLRAVISTPKISIVYFSDDRQSGRFEKVYSITRTSDGRYRYEVDRKFRDYDTPEEGIRDHAKVLSAKRYAAAWAYRNDITRFAYEIAKAGYCTAEPAAYADLISKIARMIERA